MSRTSKLAAILHQLQTARQHQDRHGGECDGRRRKDAHRCEPGADAERSLRRSVLLIDADLRRPSIHKMFQIANTPD